MRNYRLNNSERKFINEIQTLTPNKNLATREINLLDANGNNLKSYQISDLTPFLKGMLYERMVGIHFENNGYDVEYCGLGLGPLKLCHYLLTKGVTENGMETVFG